MLTMNDVLVVRKDDYQLLLSYVNGARAKSAFDHRNAVLLKAELKKARLVEGEEFPDDAIGINSTVRVKTEETSDIMEIVLVTPEKADIKAGRISIMSPIGTALLGFRKGQQVKWKVPSGKKTFTILDVTNDQ